MFPGDNVPDILIFEAAEGDAVTTLELKTAPTERVDVDAVMDSGIHGFGLDGAYVGVVNAYGVSPPETVEFVEFPRQYFMPMGIALGWRVEA